MLFMFRKIPSLEVCDSLTRTVEYSSPDNGAHLPMPTDATPATFLLGKKPLIVSVVENVLIVILLSAVFNPGRSHLFILQRRGRLVRLRWVILLQSVETTPRRL